MQNMFLYSKEENKFISKGFLIKKAERFKSLNYINLFLKKKLCKILKIKKNYSSFDLNKIHNYTDEKNLNKIRLKLINEINKDTKFRKNYFLLACSTLSKIIGNELAMQNNINLSIQLPNDESSILPIHSDTWSGDSPFETVLWLPLVNCYRSKSMFILKAKKVNALHKKFNNKKIKSVSDLYRSFKKDFIFIKINFGNFLLFNQNLPHGNQVNKTKETRVSLNCRFKGLFTPYFQKKLGSFFSPLSVKPASRVGLEYKFPGEK